MRERIEEIPRGTVVFRSHGVSQRDLEKARKRGLRIIDATCPIVKQAQLFAKFLYRQGYSLLIVGDVHHPEVEAIRSYVDDRVDVIAAARELQKLGPWKKLGVIAQTTQSFNLLKEVAAASLERAQEVRVFNTICQATAIRQREAVEIAKKVDCMIVVGGYNSGNTQRLASICREVQPKTHHIEEARELRPKMLARKKRIGLTAGASTPFWIIQEVEGRIKQLEGRNP
jgi:4-hydroxy-3-methylbut-2-enyl diphosphate reductase